MILLIRDNECFEPRVRNYCHYFERNNIDYHVVGWNRDGHAQETKKVTYFQRRAQYGKRMANIPNKLLWMLFVCVEIIRFRKQCTVIHACDVDSAFPALIVGHILRKNIIFDVFDWMGSADKRGLVYRAIDFMENATYRRADSVILCDEERITQAKTQNPNVYILPNIPAFKFEFNQSVETKITQQRKSHKYIVSYVGVFDLNRGLENLLEVISNCPDLMLNIAGFGALEEMILEYSDKYKNICYWGRVEYSIGQTIMKCSDLLAAMYYLTNPVHRYAAPNKYYESLCLEVPIITTRDTAVGNKTSRYQTGFVIGETKEELFELLNSTELTEAIKSQKRNCKEIWKTVYSDYFDSFMDAQYKNIIHKQLKYQK